MNAQILTALLQNLQLRWQISRNEIIGRYAILIAASLGLVLFCSLLGKISAWGVNSGQYWMWSVSIFVFGAIYLMLIYPGAVISISSALFGNQDKRINTRAPVPEIAPKVSSFFATLATGWVLFPVVIMAAIPAQNLGAFWIAAMSAGALAFLIFNRPNRGTFTLWIGCGISGVFLVIAALLNIIPTAIKIWGRHVAPEVSNISGVSTPIVPGWLITILWVVLALVVLAVVIRLMTKLLGGVLGAAEGIIKTLITAIATIIVVAIIIGGLGYALYAIGVSQANPSYAAPIPTPTCSPTFSEPIISEQVQKNSDDSYSVTVPSSRYGWTQVQLPAGTYNVQATGQYQWDPQADPDRINPAGASWTPESVSNPQEFLIPSAPICGLIGKACDKVTYLGESSQIQVGDQGLQLGINERWDSSAFADNSGDINVTLTPAK